jgi:putative sterol carrier protein
MAELSEITERLQKAVSNTGGLDRPLKIDLKGDGIIRLDGSTVNNEDGPADTTITVAKDDLEAMARGELDPTMAFMTGKLKIDGDMSVAMKLQPILSQARA